MAGIAPLQLPDYAPAPQINWSPLNQIGQSIGDYRRQNEIKQAMSESLVDGRLDPQLAVANLAKHGLADEARTMINTLTAQGTLGVHQGTLDLARQKYFNERNDEAARAQREQRLLQGLPDLGGVGPQSSIEAPSGVAAVRNNNPGAMWPGPSSAAFGATGYQNIAGGNKIATFPDAESGAAAQFDLLNRNYTGMRLADAISKWSGGNASGQYVASVSRATGLRPDTIITPELLQSPAGIDLSRAMARVESGGEFPLSNQQWANAQSRAFGQARPVPATPIEGVQIAQQGPLTGVNVPQAAPPSEIDKAISQYQKILESPDISDNTRKAIEARVKRMQAEQDKNPDVIAAQAQAKEFGKEKGKKIAEFPQALKSTQITSNAWDEVIGATDELGLGGKAQADRMKAATSRDYGLLYRNDPLGEGWTWASRLASLKNKLAIAAIGAMREQSKTGGAAGNMTQNEWPIFMEQIDSLDPNMGPDEFKKSLQNIQRHAKRLKSVSQEAFYRDYPQARTDETVDLNPPIANPEQVPAPTPGERTTKSGVKWSF